MPNLREYGDPNVLVGLAREAEQAGWDGFFVWDHILHRRAEPEPVVDPWVTLGACAAQTDRITLGTLITPVSRRRPWKLARELATLNVIAQNRVVLGAGLGSPRHDEFEAFGEEADDRRRAARLDEGLEVLAGLLSGEPYEHHGAAYDLEEMQFLPAAPTGSRPPIWIGGNWPNPRPFRRAARWDGVVPEKVGGQLPSPEELRDVIAFIDEHRDRGSGLIRRRRRRVHARRPTRRAPRPRMPTRRPARRGGLSVSIRSADRRRRAAADRDGARPMTPVPLALIGAGRMGRMHLQALTDSEALQIVTIVEPSEAARGPPRRIDSRPTVYAELDQALDAGGSRA